MSADGKDSWGCGPRFERRHTGVQSELVVLCCFISFPAAEFFDRRAGEFLFLFGGKHAEKSKTSVN